MISVIGSWIMAGPSVRHAQSLIVKIAALWESVRGLAFPSNVIGDI